MSDYEDEESGSSEDDVAGAVSLANGGVEEEEEQEEEEEEEEDAASDRGESIAGEDEQVGNVSEKEEERYEEIRSHSGSEREDESKGSVDTDEERDDAVAEENDVDEEAEHTGVVPSKSAIFSRSTEPRGGRAGMSGEDSRDSDYEGGVELATNRQEAFSEGESQSAKGDFDEGSEENERNEGEPKEGDSMKDLSYKEAPEKDSDEDYQVCNLGLSQEFTALTYFQQCMKQVQQQNCLQMQMRCYCLVESDYCFQCALLLVLERGRRNLPLISNAVLGSF